MDGPSSTPAARAPARPKKLKTFDDDDIVRYAPALDVPIVGLVRSRDEYKEMREMSLIHGTVLGLEAGVRAAKRSADNAGNAEH